MEVRVDDVHSNDVLTVLVPTEHDPDLRVRRRYFCEPTLDSPMLETHPAWHGVAHRFERAITSDQMLRLNAAEMQRLMQLLPPLDAVRTEKGVARNATAIFVACVPQELVAYFTALKPFKYSLTIEPLQFVRPDGSHVLVGNEFMAKLRWIDPRFGAHAKNTSLMPTRLTAADVEAKSASAPAPARPPRIAGAGTGAVADVDADL